MPKDKNVWRRKGCLKAKHRSFVKLAKWNLSKKINENAIYDHVWEGKYDDSTRHKPTYGRALEKRRY